jgi:hypothetical protein
MNIIKNPENFSTNESDWWFIFDEDTNTLIVPVIQCSGSTSSPYTLAIGSSEEECINYTEENNIKQNS